MSGLSPLSRGIPHRDPDDAAGGVCRDFNAAAGEMVCAKHCGEVGRQRTMAAMWIGPEVAHHRVVYEAAGQDQGGFGGVARGRPANVAVHRAIAPFSWWLSVDCQLCIRVVHSGSSLLSVFPEPDVAGSGWIAPICGHWWWALLPLPRPMRPTPFTDTANSLSRVADIDEAENL